MLSRKKIVCVLPAYNAAKTLEITLKSVPQQLITLFILVDDCSSDETVVTAEKLAQSFPLKIIRHDKNLGYGGNQKTCYREALAEQADVIVMLHPDYQYEPRLMGAISSLVESGVYDVALGSRILGRGALKGGMPLYKYLANRLLTLIENVLIGQKLSEYHTGYRAFSRKALQSVAFNQFSNDFIFDNEILVECHRAGLTIGEISVPTKYFPEASSISFWRSVRYGLGVLRCSGRGFLYRFTPAPASLWSASKLQPQE